MKKRMILGICGILVVLSGCSVEPTWETVDDGAVQVSTVVADPYVILFGLPSDAARDELWETPLNQRYAQTDGDYEIVSTVIAKVGLDEAVFEVSGVEREKLNVLETTRFGLPEYQFAWSEDTDEGNMVFRASLVEDEDYFYGLIFSVKEEEKVRYNDCAEAVFASFGLHGDEGF